jgi:transcriptional regulator with XRE-family HTH domain
MSAVGKEIQRLRNEAGYSVRRLADLLGKSAGYISQIEARGEIPTPELLIEIACLFNVAPEPLFELAKQGHLERTDRELTERYKSALALYRKDKK